LHSGSRQFHGAQDQHQLRPSRTTMKNTTLLLPTGRAGGLLRVSFDAPLDILPQRARHAGHPHNHGHDEHGGHQHQHALEAILVDRPALEQQRSRNTCGAGQQDASPGVDF